MSTTPDRITVGLDKPGRDALDRLAERLGMTKSDVINRAVKLYDLVQTELDQDHQLAVVDDDEGTVTRIHIL